MEDPLVREAFVRSIDRDHLNEYFYNNRGFPAFTILPPRMPGYNSETSIATFDPQEARAALEASTYNDGLPEIVYSVWGYGDEEDPYTDAVINMWRENLGVEVIVEYVDPDNFSEQALANENQLIDYGWCADYPDPENFLDLLFHTEGGFNVSGYSNPGVDTRLDQARAEQDPSVRLSLYQQAEAALLSDFAALPTIHGQIFTLVAPNVEGFVLSPIGVPFIHRISLQSEQP
jgi:oligopeptide transport system substrate-binding protein